SLTEVLDVQRVEVDLAGLDAIRLAGVLAIRVQTGARRALRFGDLEVDVGVGSGVLDLGVDVGLVVKLVALGDGVGGIHDRPVRIGAGCVGHERPDLDHAGLRHAHTKGVERPIEHATYTGDRAARGRTVVRAPDTRGIGHGRVVTRIEEARSRRQEVLDGDTGDGVA